MAYRHAERLSALDETFLALEEGPVHMHVGSVGIFDAGPLARPDGGIDMERIRALSGAALRRSPRFRMRLEATPLTGRRVWVDDARFHLDYHLRHTALPEPGDERQLKRLAGRIFSQRLEREKPLWEMWVVEGLEGGRLAVVSKIHHCMIDGISGADLLAAYLRADPEEERGGDDRWIPRPPPGALGLLSADLWRRAALPARALGALSGAVRSPRRSLRAAARSLEGAAEFLVGGVTPASPSSLNVPIGPHRRFDWTRFAMDDVREVRAKLGGTVNDVILAVVAGALREFLARRGEPVDELGLRAFVPVSTRTPEERGRLGNRVTLLLADLPVDEPDPRRRHARVVETTGSLKRSPQVEGGELIEEVADWTLPGLLAGVSRLGASRRAYNVVVTNVPGPPFPVFLEGARMREVYPLVPLFLNQSLGIAIFSYDGGLHWGLDADWDAVPDLHDLVGDLEVAFEGLRKL